MRSFGISSNRGMLQVIGKNQFNPNSAPSAANANVRRHSPLRHSLLTGVKRLQVSHDCFGIGAYHVRTEASGRGEACRFARLRSSAA